MSRLVEEAPSSIRSLIVPLLVDVTKKEDIIRAKIIVENGFAVEDRGLFAIVNNGGIYSPG